MFFGSLGQPDIAGAVVTTFAVAACTSAIAASVWGSGSRRLESRATMVADLTAALLSYVVELATIRKQKSLKVHARAQPKNIINTN